VRRCLFHGRRGIRIVGVTGKKLLHIEGSSTDHGRGVLKEDETKNACRSREGGNGKNKFFTVEG